jgi:uncharacterized damage-inducible protein DinB
MVVSQRAVELSGRFTALNNEVTQFVESCSDEDWHKKTTSEGWTVGVVTRHIAADHYGVLDWAKMIVEGKPLPDVSFDAVNQFNAQHAQENADCTKGEVLGLLREGGTPIAEYAAGLSDAELDRTAYLSLTGGDISTQRFVETIIVHLGSEHLASAKAAVES